MTDSIPSPDWSSSLTFNQDATCAKECASIPPPPGGKKLKCRTLSFKASNFCFNCSCVSVPLLRVSSGRDASTKSKTESLSMPPRLACKDTISFSIGNPLDSASSNASALKAKFCVA
ncbi:hypothetical protein V8G54_002027 [Vigna mungo]|uniref:Uncharacterized protein n=1 Tax=Vigna mungo TaxID=3915 RepID=A0AAQ3PBH8_VIGMU